MCDRLYLTILRGPTPKQARPILATEDETLIRAVGREIALELGLRREDWPVDGELQIVRETPAGQTDPAS